MKGNSGITMMYSDRMISFEGKCSDLAKNLSKNNGDILGYTRVIIRGL